MDTDIPASWCTTIYFISIHAKTQNKRFLAFVTCKSTYKRQFRMFCVRKLSVVGTINCSAQERSAFWFFADESATTKDLVYWKKNIKTNAGIEPVRNRTTELVIRLLIRWCKGTLDRIKKCGFSQCYKTISFKCGPDRFDGWRNEKVEERTDGQMDMTGAQSLFICIYADLQKRIILMLSLFKPVKHLLRRDYNVLRLKCCL